MYEKKLFIKDSKICDTTDECIKNNLCANTMWLLSVLELLYIMILNRYINAPGYGRIKIDGINLSNKTYLKQNNCMIGTE